MSIDNVAYPAHRPAAAKPAERLPGGLYVAVKPVTDALAAATLLILTSPLIAAAIVLVKLTSPGPVIYSQVRVGLRGRTFTIYKIRSMRYRCEDSTGPIWSKGRDTRVTPIGRVLRKTHVDELPQLWNVIRGDMSLVGPRPERPELVPDLQLAFPHYDERHQVRPGLTGLAQLQQAPDVDLESVRRKLVCDLHYVRKVSLSLDLRILAGTIFHVLGIPFSISGRMLWVPRRESIERVAHPVAEPADTTPQCWPA